MIWLIGASSECRFLQQNSLVSLRGLTNAPALATLNVSNNALSSLAGVEACPRLESLLAAGNRLSSLEAWRPLQSCVKLNSLDLQDNELEDPEGLLTFLQVRMLAPRLSTNLGVACK